MQHRQRLDARVGQWLLGSKRQARSSRLLLQLNLTPGGAQTERVGPAEVPRTPKTPPRRTSRAVRQPRPRSWGGERSHRLVRSRSRRRCIPGRCAFGLRSGPVRNARNPARHPGSGWENRDHGTGAVDAVANLALVGGTDHDRATAFVATGTRIRAEAHRPDRRKNNNPDHQKKGFHRLSPARNGFPRLRLACNHASHVPETTKKTAPSIHDPLTG